VTNCVFCEQNGASAPAAYEAPQDNGNDTWEWVNVCEDHASDWWDGSDYPDGRGAPVLRPILILGGAA
jgi:hypothetical protein